MADLDAIWDRARTDLVVKVVDGGEDVFCWENARRIAQSTLRIIQMADVRGAAVDEAALLAAGLYHDVASADLLRQGELEPHELFARGRARQHREQSAARMKERLADVLSDESAVLASEAILTLNDRDAPSIEGRVVSDARNLNDIGLLSLWPLIRRSMAEGLGVESLIETWKRQKEYHFWEARINESFHFEAVRKIAEQRLAQFDQFVADVAHVHHGLDLSI
jgi:hypothetical protein